MPDAGKEKPRPKQLDGKVVPAIIKYASRANKIAYRVTGGKVGGRWHVGSAWRRGVPVCLLTTIGRKSGAPRTVPLLFMRDEDRVVLVASQGGLPRHPLWYHNIEANPNVTIQIGRMTTAMRARTASTEERAALWPRLLEVYADFDDYQSWTEREIPVVICEPRS